MRYEYTTQPDGGQPRPLLRVEIGGSASTLALVDSGAVNTLLPSWVAGLVGVDLEGTALQTVRIGSGLHARFTTVPLSAAGMSWEAEVGFSDHPLLERWGVLGHAAFFRFFSVTFQAKDLQFEVTPGQG